MIGAIYEVMIAFELSKMKEAADRRMREALTPEAYKEWKRECEAERRHNELCQAIKDAGNNARPYNFWGTR